MIDEHRKEYREKNKGRIKLCRYNTMKICSRCRIVKPKTDYEKIEYISKGKVQIRTKPICNECRYIESSSDEEI